MKDEKVLGFKEKDAEIELEGTIVPEEYLTYKILKRKLVPVVSKKVSEKTAWNMFMMGVAYTQTHPDLKLLKDWTDEEEIRFKKEIDNLIKEKSKEAKKKNE